jgi:hypothetical protein
VSRLTVLRHSHPAPPAVAVRHALLVVAAALPIVLATIFLSGTPGAVWTVLGLVAGFVSRVFLATARSTALAVVTAGMVAAATAASGRALLAGLIVAAAAAVAGVADRWSADVATLAPMTAAIARVRHRAARRPGSLTQHRAGISTGRGIQQRAALTGRPVACRATRSVTDQPGPYRAALSSFSIRRR